MAGAPAGNERGRATRRRVLEAASACFEARGLALTIDEVARTAGTTRMTVHRHTGGREALLTHLVLHAAADLGAELRLVLDAPQPFVDRLVEAVVRIVVEIRAVPHLAGLFTGGDVTGTWPVVDPDERVLAAIHGFLRPYLAAAAADGELRADVDATLDWLLRQVLVFLVVPDAAPDEGAVRWQVRTFVLPAVAHRSDRATR